MNYAEAIAKKTALESECANASAAFNAVAGAGSSAFGMTPDAVKFGPEYRAASARYKMAHAALREFNGWFLKNHGAEYKRQRRQRR